MFPSVQILPSIGDEGQSIGSMYAILEHLGVEDILLVLLQTGNVNIYL